MKNTIRGFVMTLSIFLILGGGIVMAAPLDNDTLTVLGQRILPGTLSLKAPADVDLPDVTVSSQIENTTVTALDFQVDDARGTKVPPGWSATVTMTKLASLADATTNLPFIDPIDETSAVYSLTPLSLVSYNGAGLTNVALGSAEDLVEAGTTGVSTAKTVMTAASTSGNGRFECDLQIDVAVPANSVTAEDYSSTLTFTVA